MANLREEQLLKALSDMEGIAKGEDSGMTGVGNKTPTTTAQANGGLSDEGDKQELAVTAKSVEEDEDAGIEKGKKGKKMSLKEWAEEEETEHADMDKGGYGDDDEDESMDDDDDDDDEGESMDKGSKCKKSMDISDLLKSDTDVGPVIDAVPVIEQFVDAVSESDNELRKSVDHLSRRLGGQQNVLKAMSKVLLGMQETLGNLMDQPANSRRTVLSKAEIHERFEDEGPQFSKSQVLDAMVNLCQRGQVTPVDVSRFEVTSSMEPNVRKAVEDELKKSA